MLSSKTERLPQTSSSDDDALTATIAERAYFKYLEGGSQPDAEVSHWLAAEAEIKAERQASGGSQLRDTRPLPVGHSRRARS
jgi:Protein of unknown function (DUF2934)